MPSNDTEEAPRDRAARWAVWLAPSRIVAVAVLGSIPVKLLSNKLVDPDLWWHLKTGQLIARTHAIPAVDPYSYTAPGKPWVVQEWGSELILHGIRDAFGLYGILVYRALLPLAIYALVAWLLARRMGTGTGMWALLALTAFAGSPNWTERPNLLSFLLFVVTLHLLDRGGRTLWWFVPLAVVWANLHGMVIVGVGLVAVVAASEWMKVAMRWEGADRARARLLGLVAGAGLLATFANPYGPGLLTHAFRLVRIVQGFVGEWASPNFKAPGPIIFLALLLLTVVALALGPRRPDPTDVALALAFTTLALQAARNLAIGGIVLGTVCARYLPAAVASLPRQARRRADVGETSSVALGLMGLALAVGGLGVVLAAQMPRSDAPVAIVDRGYPIAAIDALDRPGVRVFAHDGWAGLVIERACGMIRSVAEGCPHARVYIDLRWDFYGAKLSRSYGRTHDAAPEWQSNLDTTCTTHVLLRPRDPLAQVLKLADGWLVEREDLRSVTFVRANPTPGCERFPIPAPRA